MPALPAEEDEEDDKPKKAKKLLVIGGAGVVVFAALAWVGTQFLRPDPVSPPVVPPQTPPVAPQTPQGQAVAKASDAVAANNDRQSELPTDDAKSPDATKAGDSAAADAPTTGSTAAVQPKVEPEPVTPAVVEPEPPPPPSPAFRAWVQNLHIGSVRGGNPARLQVGGVTYIPGDAVNPQLGILFDNYDNATRMIRFKDRNTGATVERRF